MAILLSVSSFGQERSVRSLLVFSFPAFSCSGSCTAFKTQRNNSYISFPALLQFTVHENKLHPEF